jgi:uncharacterized membrane protein YsdA (DUF1294 family)
MPIGTTSTFPWHLMAFAPYVIVALMFVAGVIAFFGRSLVAAFDSSLKDFVPANPLRWRRCVSLAAILAAAAWIGGIFFLGLLRDSQLGADALEADRCQFCEWVACFFALPYRLVVVAIGQVRTLTLLQHCLWIFCALCILHFCASGPIFPWLGTGLRRVFAVPLLVVGVLRTEPLQASPCAVLVLAPAAPLTLLLFSTAGVIPLPTAALWYLLAITLFSLLTLGTFADDKLAAQWNELCDRRDEEALRAYEQSQRDILAAQKLEDIAEGLQFDDDDYFLDEDTLPERPRTGGGKLRRVPEALLVTFALLGGWPGALTGQHLLNHKTSDGKAWLVTHLYAAIVLHVALALTALYRWA